MRCESFDHLIYLHDSDQLVMYQRYFGNLFLVFVECLSVVSSQQNESAIDLNNVGRELRFSKVIPLNLRIQIRSNLNFKTFNRLHSFPIDVLLEGKRTI